MRPLQAPQGTSCRWAAGQSQRPTGGLGGLSVRRVCWLPQQFEAAPELVTHGGSSCPLISARQVASWVAACTVVGLSIVSRCGGYSQLRAARGRLSGP